MSDAVFVIHQESDKKWIWHLIEPGGETIANSFREFETEDECMAEIENVIQYASSAKILKK